ncbi:MAG: hypothetical protein LBM02_01705, partial [Lachnospiraceae bacterium]|nr:hypothetical protein [Lachnospiraceae bacterium]
MEFTSYVKPQRRYSAYSIIESDDSVSNFDSFAQYVEWRDRNGNTCLDGKRIFPIRSTNGLVPYIKIVVNGKEETVPLLENYTLGSTGNQNIKWRIIKMDDQSEDFSSRDTVRITCPVRIVRIARVKIGEDEKYQEIGKAFSLPRTEEDYEWKDDKGRIYHGGALIEQLAEPMEFNKVLKGHEALQPEPESEQRQKSISGAEETAKQAADLAAIFAMDSLGTYIPLSIMSKIMTTVSEFEVRQAEQMRQAMQIIKDGNYYRNETNEMIKQKMIRALPQEIAEEFANSLSETEESMNDVAMLYNLQDGKIHVNYTILRALFFNTNGTIKNADLLEIFARHELRHKDYAQSKNPLKVLIHSIPKLEEFIVSIGDVYDFMSLHPNLGTLEMGYENAIKFILSNTSYIQVAGRLGEEIASIIAKGQTKIYYKAVEEAVIELVAPMYVENPEMFDIRDEKKRLRIIAVDGYNASGINNIKRKEEAKELAMKQAQILKANGYSSTVLDHVPLNADVTAYYKLPVNVSFNVNGINLVYDAYIREIDGIHVIGLKLKNNISSELDTAQNFGRAVLSFARDVNTNSIIRNTLNTISERAASMYGIITNMKVSPTGVAMIDFVDLTDNREIIRPEKLYSATDSEKEGTDDAELNASDLNGVYVVNDLEISMQELATIDQDIKAQEMYKLDEPEKYYEIRTSIEKLADNEFVKQAAKVKMSQGATAIILDIGTDIDISDETNIKRLIVAINGIHILGLKATLKIDLSKIIGRYEEVFNKLFEIGFDGISAECRQVNDVRELKIALEELEKASNAHAINARNTVRLQNENIKKELVESIGTVIDEYNILFITDINPNTAEVLLDEQKEINALKIGYKRGRRLLEIGVEVNIENMTVFKEIITKEAKIVSAGEIRSAMLESGVNGEISRHIGKILNGIDDEKVGVEEVVEAIGFIRGVLETNLVGKYIDAFGFSVKVYNMNEVSDREALGILLIKLFVTDEKIFETKEKLREYFREKEELLLKREEAQKTMIEHKEEMIKYINEIELDNEKEGKIAEERENIQELSLSLVVINNSLNKLSFDRILDEAKKRVKPSVNAI